MGLRSAFSVFFIFFCVCVFFTFVSPSTAWGSSDLCPLDDVAFVFGSKCPAGVQQSPPLEVNGEFLDMAISHCPKNAMYSVLFHASWCPFSQNARHVFDALSNMYPQISHLVIEESSALPSVFSRYGVHSFPSIVIVNQTTRVRYKGLKKDLDALMEFYRKVSGLEPIVYIFTDVNTVSESKSTLGPWHGSSREILRREPYLSFAILFICIRAVLYFFPGVLHKLYLLFALYSFPFNLGIFEGSCRLLERTLQLIDTKRLWNRLRLSDKKRNFHKGANNARVWASSLTSVSLGESSSARTAPPES